jgi:hypothetical protein
VPVAVPFKPDDRRKPVPFHFSEKDEADFWASQKDRPLLPDGLITYDLARLQAID